MKYGVTIHGEADISDAILEILEHNDYQLIILFCEGDFLALLEVIRGLAETPVLVIRPQYDGAEKVMATNAGAGRVYTHEQICGHIWGEEGGISGGALWNLVSRLRTKIACGGGDGTVLQTVRDVGYRIEKVKTA